MRTARPAQRAQGKGRQRLRGDRLPPMHELSKKVTSWRKVELLKQGRTVKRLLHGFTCQWYHVCRQQPVRVVLVRDPAGTEDELHVVCTDPTLPDAVIVQEFFERWGIEDSIEEAKGQMGMEKTRGWCAKTVSRQAPLTMLLGSLVKLWYVQHIPRGRHWQPAALPWYPHKRGPSFRDMLAALRKAIWRQRLLGKLHPPSKLNDLDHALLFVVCEAA